MRTDDSICVFPILSEAPPGIERRRRVAGTRKLLVVLGSGVLLLSGSSSGEAQRRSLPELKIGSRIRVQLKQIQAQRMGDVESVDTLRHQFTLRDSTGSSTFDRDDVVALELSAGRRGAAEGAGMGAIIGLKIGAVVGSIVVAVTYFSKADENCGDCIITPTPVAVVGAISLTAVTSLLGALFGAAAPGERWQPIFPE